MGAPYFPEPLPASAALPGDELAIDAPAWTHWPGLARYQPWFVVAALYNAIWGALAVISPTLLFDIVGMPAPEPIAFWQVIGMMVLVYAPAYWWVSRDPWAHRHLVVIGWLGKTLGAIGFVGAAFSGQLPWAFGLVVLTNDIVWLPAFSAFLLKVGRRAGWRSLALASAGSGRAASPWSPCRGHD